jgi:hypothetical protein
MKVGVKVSGIASSLAADAVVRLRDRIEREEELIRPRRDRRRAEWREDDGPSPALGRRRR